MFSFFGCNKGWASFALLAMIPTLSLAEEFKPSAAQLRGKCDVTFVNQVVTKSALEDAFYSSIQPDDPYSVVCLQASTVELDHTSGPMELVGADFVLLGLNPRSSTEPTSRIRVSRPSFSGNEVITSFLVGENSSLSMDQLAIDLNASGLWFVDYRLSSGALFLSNLNVVWRPTPVGPGLFEGFGIPVLRVFSAGTEMYMTKIGNLENLRFTATAYTRGATEFVNFWGDFSGARIRNIVADTRVLDTRQFATHSSHIVLRARGGAPVLNAQQAGFSRVQAISDIAIQGAGTITAERMETTGAIENFVIDAGRRSSGTPAYPRSQVIMRMLKGREMRNIRITEGALRMDGVFLKSTLRDVFVVDPGSFGFIPAIATTGVYASLAENIFAQGRGGGIDALGMFVSRLNNVSAIATSPLANGFVCETCDIKAISNSLFVATATPQQFVSPVRPFPEHQPFRWLNPGDIFPQPPLTNVQQQWRVQR